MLRVQPSSESPNLSDTALVAAIVDRRCIGLAEVYQRHAGTVFALALRLLGDTERASDITQDVFMRMWEQPERYDPERGTLRTFLLVDAHGRSVDRIRADVRRAERDIAYTRSGPTNGCYIDSEIESVALRVYVRDALDTLPLDERVAIECAYFGAHTYQEVAEILQCPEGTIKSRIRTGLRRLHDYMTDLDIDPDPST